MRALFLIGAAACALFPATAMAQQSDKAAAAPDGDALPPTIVVTASPLAHAQDDTPAIVEKVDSEKILTSGGASIADALKDVPGVSASGFASGASRPIIRGMDSTRVRILEDGSSSGDVSDIGPDHGVPIDPLAVRSIEVVRGAGTLRYGSQAIGGVINAINNRVPGRLPAQAFSGELTGSYDTVSNTWQGSGLVDAAIGNLALHADGFYRHADDYDTPLGKQTNSFFHGSGESLGASYFFNGGDSHVGAAIIHYDAQYGIPADDPYIDMHQTKVLTKSVFALGSGLLRSLSFDGSYADYQHQEKNPDGSVNTTFKNKEFDGRTELLLNGFGFVKSSALGFEYQHRDFSAVGADATYLFPSKSQSIAGYLFADAEPLPHFHLEASGRVENVQIQGTPVSNLYTRVDYTPLSGAIGALYDFGGKVKLGFTFSSTGRAPALTELFARGGHDGPGTYETGDPNLKIERANSVEASLRIRSGIFRFDGSIYSSWFKNYIYGDLTGRTCDDDGNCVPGDSEALKELFYRQQGAHFRGIEGKANFQLVKTPTGTFNFNLLGDYTRATLDDGNNVPRIPPYRLGGGLNWAGTQLDTGISLIYAGKQDKAGLFDTPTDSYVALNAQIAWRPFKNYQGIEFAIVGQNLTDDVQRNAAALNKDDVIMPGRNVRFVVRIANF